jgi:hypothetical protein
MRTRFLPLIFLLSLLAITSIILNSCSGSNSASQTSSAGRVNISISDPPTCSAPNGAFAHVFVTIRDVQIHQSDSANPGDGGWIDLTPDLKNAPRQVDLLGIANNQCVLSLLGSQVPLQAGTYQQIRLYLSDDSDASKLTNNQCGTNIVNCAVLTAFGTPQPLNMSSQMQTGIKIPSGQIAGGNFTIADGQSKDLIIDFDACASIIMQGNGQARLKPVLHAGEVKLASAISGKLVDSKTGLPIAGGSSIVALERPDANNIDRVVMQTKPDANGNFSLCPVPTGNYDVVAVAVSGTGVAYAATITTGVPGGTSMGNIPMIAQTGTNTSNAIITGQITTMKGTGNTGTATTADITAFALQQLTIGSTHVSFIIPLADQASPSSTIGLTTAADLSCPANTDCVTYTVKVPAMWPNLGGFTAGTATNYSQSLATPVEYSIGAQAFVPVPTATQNCSPFELFSNTLSGGGPLTVTAGQPSTAATIGFSGCQ